jgi:hypothetical protein
VKCSLEINSLKTKKERGAKLKLFCTPFFNKYTNLGKEIIDARDDKMNQQERLDYIVKYLRSDSE